MVHTIIVGNLSQVYSNTVGNLSQVYSIIVGNLSQVVVNNVTAKQKKSDLNCLNKP